MIDLDLYINDRLEIKLFGETIHLKEPTPRMYSKLNQIEKNLTRENIGEIRVQSALLFLNYNEEGKTFEKEQFEGIPFAVVDRITKEVVAMRERAEEDPNLKSQSRKGK